jgi:hypothetical protein
MVESIINQGDQESFETCYPSEKSIRFNVKELTGTSKGYSRVAGVGAGDSFLDSESQVDRSMKLNLETFTPKRKNMQLRYSSTRAGGTPRNEVLSNSLLCKDRPTSG